MKRWLYALPLLFVGCSQVAQDVKEGVEAAPQDFWLAVKEVILFVFDLLVGSLTGWINGLFGS